MAKQETRGYIGTYRKPGTAAVVYDPGATILEGIEKAGEAITGRIKTVRDFENAAAVRRQETLNSLAETEGMKDFTALDSLQQQLMSEIDELYRLDIASFEGDRSAYLKKQNEMQRVIGDIPALMGLIDQEAELLKENEQGGNLVKNYLKSNNENYYNFVDRASKGGKGISFRVENGNIIAQLDGKDVFNGHAYINAKKDGYDLVEYAGDYSKEINAADAQAYKGLEGLVKTQILEKVKNGTELTREEMKDYTLAKQKYKERLESGRIALPINESTYQTFTGYGEDNITPYGEIEGQDEQTREAIIEYMVNQRFPEDVVTTKIETEVGRPMTQFQKENLNLQREKLRVKKFELLQKGQVDEKVINTLNKNAEYTNIINSIITEEGDEANAVDRLAGILNRVNSDQNVNYVAGSNDDIIAQIAKDRGIDLNDADAKAKLLEEEAGKIYIQKSGGKFSEIQFDINDPNEIFEILSKNTTGISNKDILNYGYEVGEFKPGKDKFDPKQDYKKKQQPTKEVETPTDKNDQTVPPPPPQEVEQPTEVEVSTEEDTDRNLTAENKKQEDLMRYAEVTYGGPGATPLPSYKDYDFGIYLNSTDQVLTEQEDKKGNKIPATYWGGGDNPQPKRGLKADLGEDVYNGLSDSQQAMMRMMHVNIGWDPRVVMLMATGDIKGKDQRLKYLKDYDATTKLYNKNKAKFKNIDDKAMFDQWLDLYSRTEPNKPGFQKQYKQRVIDMAKAYGFKPTKAQLDKFKV